MIFKKNRKAAVTYILLAASCLFYASCTQLDSFEKNSSIPKYEWSNSYIVKSSFTIKDTLAKYNAYIVLRHTDAYKYNNIWLNIGLQSPGDSMRYQKVDMQLGSDANGWMGTGMNDIWEVRQLLTGLPIKFNRAGNYNFSITQIMRDDPLQFVMSAGIRVEKQ